jgi:hypothetical protein
MRRTLSTLLWYIFFPFRLFFACLMLAFCSVIWKCVPSTYEPEWRTIFRQIVMADSESFT